MSRLVIFLILFPFAVWMVYRARRKVRTQVEEKREVPPENRKPVRLVTAADVQRRSYPVRMAVRIRGMCCEGCAWRLEQAAAGLPDTLCAVSYERERLFLYSRKPLDMDSIRACAAQAGFEVAEKQV